MKHMDWKRRIGTVWPAHFENRKVILLYHSVGDTSWSMPSSNFCDQMSWLKDHCVIRTLTDLIKNEPADEIQVAITFDDGYSSLYNRVAPILSEYKIIPMVYINTEWISENEVNRRQSAAKLGHYPDETFLIWTEVAELHNQGWEIGSHGANHYDFTRCEDKLLEQELFASKQSIEKRLNTQCLHFSYPWGRHSKKVRSVLKSLGYQYAVAGRHGVVSARSNILALPRINIAKEYSLNDFKAIIYGKWDFLNIVHRIKGI